MDEEWEEEEQFVVVELSGIISNDFLTKSRGLCKILDIDSEKPMMQVGQYVFAGEYEDTLGTCVLFEETAQIGKEEGGAELKYMCHTPKKLMMQRIFLAEKKEGETSTGVGDEEDAACPKQHAGQHGPTDVERENTDVGEKAETSM